jgi:uncharacterized protein (TIGR00730 family)
VKRICVFAGSSPGANDAYRNAAIDLGEALAERDVELVYGGGCVGLMGVLADAALARGGRVIGVIPHTLMVREVGHRALTELHVVDSMHERKAMMAELSEGFIALPGGFGTLEEMFEILTWAQLGLHGHPCGLLNVEGYFDSLLAFLDHSVEQAFVRDAHRAMLLVDDSPRSLLDRFAAYRAPVVAKWLQRSAQT